MKKFLSLVLALVMTMSLVTVSAGAKDFTDAEDINYDAAVEVMSAIGVVDGDKAGNFNPTNGLTRGAAAKIICNLILGPTTAAELNADTDPYPDVAVDSTFAGYIAYCQKEGIISGYADGTFKPANPLTGYAFMKMLLGALGYDAAVEGYTGANWSINVAKQAIGIGLNAGLKTPFNGSDFVTREEAMLYAFNTLQATMVEYDTVIEIGDITIAGSQAKNVAQTGYKDTMNAANLQFAEKYFSKLNVTPSADAFGRPANKWVNNKTTIGTYADYTLLAYEYTAAVKGNELYEDLGKDVVNTYDFDIYANGNDVTSSWESKIAKTYKQNILTSGNGVLTEVYVDVDAEEVTVVVIDTFLAKVTSDYNTKKDEATLNIYGADLTAGVYTKLAGDEAPATVKGEDFAIVETLKEDDFVLVTLADGAVQSIETVEVMEGVEITSFKKADNYTIDGETYKRAATGEYDGLLTAWTDGTLVNMKDKTYNVYMDNYGYVIGIEIVEEEDNFVFIAGYDRSSSNLSTKYAEALAIFTDGTVANITVKIKNAAEAWDSDATLNSWFTYTVDKNDVYTLTDLSATYGQFDDETYTAKIDKAHISIQNPDNNKFVYGNADTVYLMADTSKINGNDGSIVIDDVANVVTGVKNVSLDVLSAAEVAATYTGYRGQDISGGVYTLYKASTGAIIAVVTTAEDDSVSNNLVFVTGKVERESYDKVADEFTWTQKALLNGEEIVLTETGDALSVLSDGDQYSWCVVKYKADGTVKDVTPVTYAATGDYITNVPTFNGLTGTAKTDVDLVRNFVNTNNKLTMVGYTLHIEPTLAWNTGIDVAEDCNAVVVEKFTSGDVKVETYDSSSNNVKAAINALQSNPLADGVVYAVMKDGLATTVIFVDNTLQSDDGTRVPTAGTAGITNSVINYMDSQVVVYGNFVLTGSDAAQNQAIFNAMKATLEDAGYSYVSWGGVEGATAWQMTVTNGNGGPVTFTANYVKNA